MPAKITFNTIKLRVENLGYEIYDTEDTYKGVNKILIHCNGCRTPHRVQLADLEKIEPGAKRCKECGVKKRALSKANNSGVHRNIRDFLENLGYTLLTEKDEIIKGMETKKTERFPLNIKFKCDKNHINILEYASFNNKKDKTHFCSKCVYDNKEVEIRTERLDKIEILFEKYGHTLTEFEPDNLGVCFKCGFCNNDTRNNINNLFNEKYTGRCISCMNIPNRKNIDELRNELKSIGFELMMEDGEYTDNKHIKVGCSECYNCIWDNIALHDVKRRLKEHYHCENCGDGCHGNSVEFYKPYCTRCFGILNPDVKIPRKYKTKENFFVEEFNKFLENNNIVIDNISFDKHLKACSKRRPDIFIECMTHCIVLELDEHQHIGYSCENKRMCEIFEDVGYRHIVFIRLNPDSYTNKFNVKIPSCFTYNDKGEMNVWEKEWGIRLKVFTDMFMNYFNLKTFPEKDMTIEQLFYNGFEYIPEDIVVLKNWSEGKLSGNKHKRFNQYRICKDNKGEFLEVKLGENNVTFVCDTKFLSLVEERVWILKTIKGKYGYVRCRKTNKYDENLFQNVAYPNTKTGFLDKNSLNLREYNLINNKIEEKYELIFVSDDE